MRLVDTSSTQLKEPTPLKNTTKRVHDYRRKYRLILSTRNIFRVKVKKIHWRPIVDKATIVCDCNDDASRQDEE